MGLALASGQKVEVRVLDVSSALDEGAFTGETAIVKTVSSTAVEISRTVAKLGMSASLATFSPGSWHDSLHWP